MDASDHIVWDVSDPFAPQDPTQSHLRALIQAEIERMRKYESIGPLQSIQDESDTEVTDYYESEEELEERPTRIRLPRLLHARPICYVLSPTPPSSTCESPIDPLYDLSSTDEDEVVANERARKAKRDAHRSRLKILAITRHGSQF